MTVQDLIKSTLRLIGAIGQGEEPTTAELTDAMTALNLMLDSWQNSGYISPVQYSDLLTDIKHAKSLQRAFRYNLAIEIAPEYGITISAEVLAMATKAMQVIRNAHIEMPEATFDIPITDNGWYDGRKS